MKQLIILAVCAYAAYQGFLRFNEPSAFDPNGEARTLLFTFEKCGKPCRDAREFLAARVKAEEIVAEQNTEGSKRLRAFGGTNYMPYVVVGDFKLKGYQPAEYLNALVQTYGLAAASRAERLALESNFDNNGEPLLVMYSTKSCGYCTKARNYFNAQGLAFVERDIELSATARRDYDALYGGGTPLLYKGLLSAYGFNPNQIARDLKL